MSLDDAVRKLTSLRRWRRSRSVRSVPETALTDVEIEMLRRLVAHRRSEVADAIEQGTVSPVARQALDVLFEHLVSTDAKLSAMGLERNGG